MIGNGPSSRRVFFCFQPINCLRTLTFVSDPEYTYVNKVSTFLQRKIKQLKGKIKLLKLQLSGNPQKRWYGSEYGGFFLREDVLKKNSNLLVYSCGVGKDISFDLQVLKKFPHAKILAFDPTPVSIQWIQKQGLPTGFQFFPIGIGAKNVHQKMYFPKDYRVSYSIYSWDNESKDEILVEMKRIECLAKEQGHSYIDILKMDIEGSEFDVLDDLDFSKLRFGQILVEFHERFLSDGKMRLEKTLSKLQENGYECFAISDDFEYSFIHRSLLE